MACGEVFCEECDSCMCEDCGGYLNCDCPPKVINTEVHSITYEVKVTFHEWRGDPLKTDDDREIGYTHLSDAIKEWDFGNERCGAHHWDRESCHVTQCPVTKKYILLYM